MSSAHTPASRRIVFVHAHPDDETLATGGTMAHYAASGAAVTLVTCTLGEQGEVIPPELGRLVAEEADQLGGYRIGELAAACAALGVTDHRFLGGAGRWRDSGMALAGHGVRAATPEVLHPRAFARPESYAEQVEQLAVLLAEVRPEVVVTYAADGGYGHPDHVRAHDVTVAAVARVPARLFHHVTPRGPLEAALAGLAVAAPMRMPEPDELPSVPDELVTTRIDVRAQRARVVAAMRAHVTQVIVASDDVYSVSNLVAQPVPDVDAYVAADGVAATADDLFGVAP